MCRMAEHDGSTGCRKFDHLIAVTSRHLCQRAFPEQLERICRHHPKAVILREKDLMEDDYLFFAKDALTICREHGVRCVLHTFTKAALQLEHPYLHLPRLCRKKAENLTASRSWDRPSTAFRKHRKRNGLVQTI